MGEAPVFHLGNERLVLVVVVDEGSTVQNGPWRGW